MPENYAKAIEQTIRTRKTEKVLCPLEDAKSIPAEVEALRRPQVMGALETAGWAPFHFARTAEVAEPWRSYVLWQDQAVKLAGRLRDEMGDTTKVPLLLGGCSACVVVTWLPEFGGESDRPRSAAVLEEQRVRDEEHLAAASAMVQNLLLILTAHGMGTYWSSGGRLRKPEVFEWLGIPVAERFLAGVFIEYPEMMGQAKERKPGSHRDKRSLAWIRHVEI